MNDFSVEENATVAAVAARYKHRINRALGGMSIELRDLVLENEADRRQPDQASPLHIHAADALRRARRLPIGADRNDLRQLAYGLLWLDRRPSG